MTIDALEITADVCTSCGCLFEDEKAHRRHHRDIGTLASVLQRLVDAQRQQNSLTLGKGLTISSGGISTR